LEREPQQLEQSKYYLYFSSVFPSKTFTDVEDKQGERSQAFFTFKDKLRLKETAGFMGFLVIKVYV